MTRPTAWAALALGSTLAIGTTTAAGRAGETIDESALLKEVGFSAHEIQRIGRREVVARSLDADGSTIALAVAATIGITAEFYLEKFRDIEAFKKSREVLQIGRFRRPPSAADMAALTLDEADIEDLKGCRVGDCGVKLDAPGIRALASRDARIDVTSARLREHLAAYVQRYVQSGDRELMEYHDTSPPGRVADGLREIGHRTPYLRRWPSLWDAVFNFTGTLPAGVEDFLYWSKEKVGPRAVVSITHALISPPHNNAAVVATKQIYVSHYGNSSLGVTILLDTGTAAAPQLRIIYLNRSRVDVFGGILGPLKRPLVRSRAREAAERMMRGLAERLEKQYAARH